MAVCLYFLLVLSGNTYSQMIAWKIFKNCKLSLTLKKCFKVSLNFELDKSCPVILSLLLSECMIQYKWLLKFDLNVASAMYQILCWMLKMQGWVRPGSCMILVLNIVCIGGGRKFSPEVEKQMWGNISICIMLFCFQTTRI